MKEAAHETASMMTPGRVVHHCSEAGSSFPDVGISVGLVDAALYAGEVPGKPGWALVVYTGHERLDVAEAVDPEEARSLIERIGRVIEAEREARDKAETLLKFGADEVWELGVIWRDGRTWADLEEVEAKLAVLRQERDEAQASLARMLAVETFGPRDPAADEAAQLAALGGAGSQPDASWSAMGEAAFGDAGGGS